MNTIVLETEDLGDFSVSLTDDQIIVLSENGTKILKDIRDGVSKAVFEEENDENFWELDEQYYHEPCPDYCSSYVDWSSYFPGIADLEIEELISDEERKNVDISLATPAGLVFLSAGFAGLFGTNPTLDSISSIVIVKTQGSFFENE